MLPLLAEKVVYSHIDKSLLEKKQKFVQHLDKEEINDFLIRKDTTETYASFSTLHSEFLQLYQIGQGTGSPKSFYKNETRIIEEEESNYRILYFDFAYENCYYRLEIGNSLSEMEDLMYVIRIFIFIVLIASIVVTFFSEAVFIEYLLRPFHKIIHTKIKHINDPESFDFTAVETHSDEFKELDQGLHLMMGRIREVFNKEKQFIANVSHELLTPIALLKNRFENLIQNQSLDDQAVDKVVSSLKTLDVLKKIINNLLLVSKIENNQYHANETVNLTELLLELIEEFDDRIRNKNISIDFNMAESVAVKGNKALLHVMFFNIIGNAIKYNVANGTIILSDGYANDQYTITIADTGPGMTPEQIGQVFDRFTRMDLNQEGQGLGLAITKSIAQFHHIAIDTTSEVGKGSSFRLLFPTEAKT
ncbi:HAMP domain-containing histidine kinase [Flavobacterium humi]|uniref:histidine kinase n=1 Tax=Flavobacterium humi TaxID=2562683 RepID=A0A4Z0L4P7_9FLAO|nr:HAMP domain-containing histidine kinase [Flavobacterium humi]